MSKVAELLNASKSSSSQDQDLDHRGRLLGGKQPMLYTKVEAMISMGKLPANAWEILGFGPVADQAWTWEKHRNLGIQRFGKKWRAVATLTGPDYTPHSEEDAQKATLVHWEPTWRSADMLEEMATDDYKNFQLTQEWLDKTGLSKQHFGSKRETTQAVLMAVDIHGMPKAG